MFGNFLLKKMLASRLGNMPEAERDKILKVVEKDPALFQKIALEAQALMKEGKDQMTAIAEAAKQHQAELEKILKDPQ